ncbi:hypothetical protein [Fimbriiglobus ruber]|uniref:Uncharacterized protein n=1 Tax=Fimbriiglobus ruber TaxID=1908690 RepID=A0A225D6N2_9BACT|nr:hypothetical protein [Fimbriiglobus ruber]OWK36643.1 hypothetical protein FRUB_09206 [Fimbriiglobus ruber]
MRQDKDRSGKWLLTHHGDAVLKLAGIDGFTAWRALQAETVAPRRLPDGLLEVRFPGEDEPTLVLVEIETYPSADADRQVLEDLLLVTLDHGITPDVVMLVLRPKGNQEATGFAERVSRRKTARLAASWNVTRLWELQADDLLAAGDVGLIPWVPLARTNDPPEDVLRRCKEALDRVTESRDRNGLIVVTKILASLAYPGHDFLNLYGGFQAMIESPLLDKVYKLMEEKAEQKTLTILREVIADTLVARFGADPAGLPELTTVTDEGQLKALHRVALTCPDVGAFVAEMARLTS